MASDEQLSWLPVRADKVEGASAGRVRGKISAMNAFCHAAELQNSCRCREVPVSSLTNEISVII
jgi:hypothetical protein